MGVLHGDQWGVAERLSDALMSSRIDLAQLSLKLGWDLADLLLRWRQEPSPAIALEIADAFADRVSEAAWGIAAMRAADWDVVPGLEDLA